MKQDSPVISPVMDQASQIDGGPAAEKLAGMIREMASQLAAETGAVPLYVTVRVQMPDDSVYEARGEPCPDGCGQAVIVPGVLPA